MIWLKIASKSSSTGSSFGRNSTTYHAPGRSAIGEVLLSLGTKPARTSDDFPEPEPPSTTMMLWSASRSRSSLICWFAPVKQVPPHSAGSFVGQDNGTDSQVERRL